MNNHLENFPPEDEDRHIQEKIEEIIKIQKEFSANLNEQKEIINNITNIIKERYSSIDEAVEKCEKVIELNHHPSYLKDIIISLLERILLFLFIYLLFVFS